MLSLLDLPDHLLVDIIAYTLDLPQDNDDTSPSISALFTKPEPNPARSLLLLCHHINHLTTRLIFSKLTFTANDTPSLRQYVNLAGLSRLPLIRNASITLYSDDDYTHDPRSSSEKEIKEATGLLKRLPESLRRLRLQPGYHEWPYFVTAWRADDRLLNAIYGFDRLEELRLDFYSNWIPLSLFSRPITTTEESLPPPPPPVFPLLRTLYLRGCLTEGLTTQQTTHAFSQAQLPSLQSLTLDGLLYDIDYNEHRTWVFLPETILAMNPLTEFFCTYDDFENNLRRTKGTPHQPMTKEHLHALKCRHGRTLKTLELSYTGCSEGTGMYEMRLERDDIVGFLEGMDGLTRVSIMAPQFALIIERSVDWD